MYNNENTQCSEPGSSAANERSTVAKFRRGIEISTTHFSPVEIFEEWQIPVRLTKGTGERLGTEGEAILLVKTGCFVIKSGNSKICKWHLSHVRKYGYNESSFFLEAGRRAETGEGVFVFLTDKGKRVHKKVSEMKEFFRFDMMCQRQTSREISYLGSRDEQDQPYFKLSRGLSMRNKIPTTQSSPHPRNRSNSHPNVATTFEFHTGTENIQQCAQTLPRLCNVKKNNDPHSVTITDRWASSDIYSDYPL